MGKMSDNRIKFNRQSLTAIEKEVNKGGFSKETFWYDTASWLAIRVRPGQSYLESAFCLYARIRVHDEWRSKLYKCHIVKIGEARNFEVSLNELVDRGQTQLHGAMRILRSVWNWAQAKYDESELFVRNPVSRAMKQLGVNINRTNPRATRLDENEFGAYIMSVLKLRESDHTSGFRNGRDALLFMLFSGVRITGTVTIRMSNIDLSKRVFKIVKKVGSQQNFQ